MFFIRSATAVLIGVFLLSSYTLAADFSGRTIKWFVIAEEGSSISQWAYFYSPLLSKALPGNPKITIRHVPANNPADGVRIFNKQVKPNGLYILGAPGLVQLSYLSDTQRVKYDYERLNVILGTPMGGVVYGLKNLGASGVQDLKKTQRIKLKYDSSGIISLDLMLLLAFDMMGMSVKISSDVKNNEDRLSALSKGKINIDYQATPVFIHKVMKEFKREEVVPLFTWGIIDSEGRFQRDPSFPDLPHFVEAYEIMYGKTPAGVPYNTFKALFTAGFGMQKVIFLPAGTPQDIIDTYTESLDKVISDLDFSQKGKDLLMGYQQLTGYEVQILKQMMISSAAKGWLKQWLRDKYKIRL